MGLMAKVLLVDHNAGDRLKLIYGAMMPPFLENSYHTRTYEYKKRQVHSSYQQYSITNRSRNHFVVSYYCIFYLIRRIVEA